MSLIPMEYDGGGYKWNGGYGSNFHLTTDANGNAIFPTNRIVVDAIGYIAGAYRPLILSPAHDGSDFHAYSSQYIDGTTIKNIPANTEIAVLYLYLEKVT